MSLLDRFNYYIQNENLFQKKDPLFLAVSGGVDSVVLCELCSRAGFSFKIAHCNFQLRGAESMRDEMFVQSLSDKYHAHVFIRKFDTEKYAAENETSIQVAARELRYKWFEELMEEVSVSGRQAAVTEEDKISTSHILHHTSYIVTAHHANDNSETLLMNFFKGTGIKGLRGILSKQGKIIRPLLFATKDDIVSFAHQNNLSFVEDSSNSSDKYTRNYFRNQLIPSLQKVFPQVEENLADNIERFKEVEILYRQAIDVHKKKLQEYKGNEVHIPVLKLLKTKPLKTVIYEIIKEYDFTVSQTEEVLHLLKSESGRYIASATHKIIKNRNWIIIAPHDTRKISVIVIAENDKEVAFEKGKLTIEKFNSAGYQLSTNNNTAVIDEHAITYPLLLRKWKQGDYFYPLGMQKKKKLSRFFIDQKMSMTEKEQAWVIESNKRIIWILGKRIDNRFRVTDSTVNIITIHFTEF